MSKLLYRHLAIIIFQEFLLCKETSIDALPAAIFLDSNLEEFLEFSRNYSLTAANVLLPSGNSVEMSEFQKSLTESLLHMKQQRNQHPDLFGVTDNGEMDKPKSLLDALYEMGAIPPYSFPINVVSAYITDASGKLVYQPERGLDTAISEYAPGRSIVVDKQTYQIGGFFSPGSERRNGQASSPARSYMNDGNYVKSLLTCSCGWFGIHDSSLKTCPFCGNRVELHPRKMLRPWGLAPRDAGPIPEAQLTEEYSIAQQPIYSTLPDADKMRQVPNTVNMRIASLSGQRIILLNQGPSNQGFVVCKDCGAAMPGKDRSVLKEVGRPYKSKFTKGMCRHSEVENINIGYDFVTDMVVLEFSMDRALLDVENSEGIWLNRASQSLAEALRLAACKELDVDFSELVTGYRYRKNAAGVFIDIYLYDSLSSGAGYSVRVAEDIQAILEGTEALLLQCDCESACYRCLKHYRNQWIHGRLDRYAALELLNWGMKGKIMPSIPHSEQRDLCLPLQQILSLSGIEIVDEKDGLILRTQRKEKRIVVYPAMRSEPKKPNTVFVSDVYLKYAKPYAMQKILDNL